MRKTKIDKTNDQDNTDLNEISMGLDATELGDPNLTNPNPTNSNLTDLFDTAISETLSNATPDLVLQAPLITKDQAAKIMFNIAESLEIPIHMAISLVFSLFLKGAANKGAPDKLSSSTTLPTGIKVTLTKGELLANYKAVTRNNHLRRMAELLSTEISNFAEKTGTPGDLWQKVNILIGPKETPLTPAERSWCSSFNQKNSICADKYPRVYTLLAVEYRIKFQSKNNTTRSAPTPTPRKGQKPKTNPKKK